MNIKHDITLRELTEDTEIDTIVNSTGIIKLSPDKIKVWTIAKYCRGY